MRRNHNLLTHTANYIRSTSFLHPLSSLKPATLNSPYQLKAVSLHAQINGGLAFLQLTHLYANASSHPLQTQFLFPVDQNVSMNQLRVKIEDTLIQTQIRMKEESKEKQTPTKIQHSSIQYDKDLQDLLVLNLGAIKPGKQIEVKIYITMTLQIIDKSFALVLSPSLTPLYRNTLSGYNITPASSKPYSIEIELKVQGNGVLERLVTLYDDMKVEIAQDKRSASLSMKTDSRDQSDFALLYRSKQISKSKLYLQTSHKYPNEVAAFVSFYSDFCPPLTQQKVDDSREMVYENKKEEQSLEAAAQFVFMLDRSASMKGKRMEMAIEAAKLFIKSLPMGSKFNVISFRSHFEEIFQGSVPLTQQNVNKAIAYLSDFEADMGGTQIYAALQNVYNSQRDPNYPLLIFLITDGAVNSPDSVINLIASNSKSGRCHCFGIGSSVSKELVKRAATAGKGSYSLIRDKEIHALNSKVIAALQKSVKPGLIDLKLTYTSTDHVLLQGSRRIPDAFHGQALNYFSILKQSYPKGATIMISAFESKSKKRVQFQMNLDNAYKLPDGEELFQICAQNAIRESESLAMKDSPPISQLSLKYKVLSSETKMIATESDTLFSEVHLVSERNQVSREKREQGIAFKLLGKKRKMIERPMIPAYSEEKKQDLAKPISNEERREETKTPGTESKRSQNSNNRDGMQQLIELQTIQGIWQPNQQLFDLALQTGKVISKEVPQNFQKQLAPDKRKAAWGTLIGVWMLQNYYTNRENEWKRIATKGRNALQELGVDDINASLSLII